MEALPLSSPETTAEPETTIPFLEGIKKLSNLAGITVYERLNASNQKSAKEEFLADETLIHPNNEYGYLDEQEIHDGIMGINETMDQLAASNWKQQKLATIVADYGIKEYDFLAANYSYNHAETDAEKQAAAKHHARANKVLYGEPDEDTFYAILNEQLAKIRVDELSPPDQADYQKMLESIGPIKQTETKVYRPKPETITRFSEMVNDFYEPFLKHVPKDQSTFTPDELCEIFNAVIDQEFGGKDAIPYHAVVTDTVSNLDTNHEKREIRIPQNAEPYSNLKCRTLLVHELGTHVMRALPYLNQDIEIFANGLPGNETFDEGIAKCVEQAIKGKYEDSGIDHYINIGLANLKGKNFREVYDIATTLKKLTGKKNNATFNQVQRCFRGTGELPNNKDLAYFNGSTRVWQYIESHLDDTDLFENLFLSGKADILNADQNRLSYEMKVGGIE